MPTELKIALAGNPNAGKTSVFNMLTGARQHVGNYPGVTVEQRWGEFTGTDHTVRVADLPGTYSLTSFSPEERVARDELLLGAHDVVVVVADSTALKRSLMLLFQVMQLGAKPVLCLNMRDEAEASGQRIDVAALAAQLDIEVVQSVGHRSQGRDELIAAIERTAVLNKVPKAPSLGSIVDSSIAQIAAALELERFPDSTRPWLATRLLVGDRKIAEELDVARNASAIALAKKCAAEVEAQSEHDIALFVTDRYFAFADTLLDQVITTPSRADARSTSKAIDGYLVHRWFGLPIFAVLMYGIFWMTFTLGEPLMDGIDAGFSSLGDYIGGLWPAGSESQLRSLLVDGIIAGVGGVVIFLPNVILLFLGLACLEDTGYMARAAFLMDRVMHKFGLHGKSFVPMMTGFGCSIPGIMATRTLENDKDRLTTMLVLPLMSCGARLTIWMLLIPAFFAPAYRAPALWGIYVVGILLAFAVALLLRKTVLSGADAPFVMELPPYRMPTAKALYKKISERAWIYLHKAGTIILSVSILLWFLTAYPKKDVYEVDAKVSAGAVMTQEQVAQARSSEDMQHSVAGRIGKAMEPAIAPMGFDWKLGTAMLGAFAAKEVFVTQLGIVYSMGETDEESEDLRTQLARDYSPLVGISLMLFLLISAPCMATFAVTRRESGSWKWAFAQLGGLTALGYIVSTIVYQVGRLLL